MTSHELARKLLAMPDLAVTVRGYKGGVDIIDFISEPATLVLNVNEEWYYGKHEYPYIQDLSEYDGKERIQAIHIGK